MKRIAILAALAGPRSRCRRWQRSAGDGLPHGKLSVSKLSSLPVPPI